MSLDANIQNQAASAVASLVHMPTANTTMNIGDVGKNVQTLFANSNTSMGAVLNEYITSHTAPENVDLNVNNEKGNGRGA